MLPPFLFLPKSTYDFSFIINFYEYSSSSSLLCLSIKYRVDYDVRRGDAGVMDFTKQLKQKKGCLYKMKLLPWLQLVTKTSFFRFVCLLE